MATIRRGLMGILFRPRRATAPTHHALRYAYPTFPLQTPALSWSRAYSTKLFVGGLSFRTSEDILRSTFAQHGQVVDVKIVNDRETGRSKGFGFVTFQTEDEAENALNKMRGQTLDGRMLRVDKASSPARTSFGSSPSSSSSFGGGPGAGFGGAAASSMSSPSSPLSSISDDWGSLPSNTFVSSTASSGNQATSFNSSTVFASTEQSGSLSSSSNFGSTATSSAFSSSDSGSSTLGSTASSSPLSSSGSSSTNFNSTAATSPFSSSGSNSSNFGSFSSSTFGSSTGQSSTLSSASPQTSNFGSSTLGSQTGSSNSSTFGSSTGIGSNTFGSTAVSQSSSNTFGSTASQTFGNSSFGSAVPQTDFFNSSSFGSAAQPSSFNSNSTTQTTSSGNSTFGSSTFNSSSFGSAPQSSNTSTFESATQVSSTSQTTTAASVTQTSTTTVSSGVSNAVEPSPSSGSSSSTAHPLNSPALTSTGQFNFSSINFDNSSYRDVDPPLPRRRLRPRAKPIMQSSMNSPASSLLDDKFRFGSSSENAFTAIPKPKGPVVDFGLLNIVADLAPGARPEGAFDIDIPEDLPELPPPEEKPKPKISPLSIFPLRSLPPTDLPYDTPEADNWSEIGKDPPKYDLTSLFPSMGEVLKKEKELHWDPYDFDDEAVLPPEDITVEIESDYDE